jgi:hypothetical protein
MGNGVIRTSWVGDFTPKAAPLNNARGGQRRFEVLEGVAEILGKREPHRGISSDEFSVFKEVGATVSGSARDLGRFVEPVLPLGGQLLQ